MNRLVTIVVAATLTLGVSALLAPSSSAQQTPCAGEKCVTEGVAAANGRGSAADPTRAIALFESGCVQGVKASCAHEALMRLAWQDDGEAVSRTLAALTEAERERLRAVYTADCDEGAMRACFHVGVLQEGGFAAPKTPPRPWSASPQAATRGSPGPVTAKANSWRAARRAIAT
ncbi:MAG: hypothetical protein IPO67_00465 [Deltaproteobacteria bacterium]|nr:hypothetical protein [Deltaproteobacteria bacterium]